MPTADANPLLLAALDYAARGWRVVPLHECVAAVAATPLACSCGRAGCESQGKHPRLKEWQKVAAADAAVVRGWWAKWPDANVGVALGCESGIVSIDVDSDAGVALLGELAGGTPERTLQFRTGKGWRLLYAIPAGLPHPPATHVVQIDGAEAVRFQAAGGQCVMPPSLHPSGARYAWVDGRGPAGGVLAEMPGWLVAEMCRPKNPTWSDQGAREAFTTGKNFNRDADWWRDVLAPAGFAEAGRAGDVLRFTRPKKQGGISVTVGHYRAKDGSPALYAFSGSIPGLEAGRCYDKFGAFAKLHHGGDFAAAGAAVGRMGYGKTPGGEPPGRAGQADRPGGTGGPAAAKGVEWGEPIPLDDPTADLPAFPLTVFPPGLADLCASAAEAVGCPPDYAATHALAVAAGAIGGAYDLQVKRGFYAPAVVWACVVAPPGSGKSPSVAPILAPLFAEQGRRTRAENHKPVYVGDVTVERLARLLEADPRGLTMVWDEMAGWLTSFNQYKAKGSGNDRAHYLSIWDGRPLKVDRAGPDKPPLFVPRPRLSVVGGIQPEVLDALREGPSDGLFDRLLFSYPHDPGLAVETFAEVDPKAQAAWEKALAELWEKAPKRDSDGDERPACVLLTDAGRPLWADWTRTLAEQAARPDAPVYFRSVAAKCQGYAARLALVVHLLREAYGESRAMGVGEDDMYRGTRLATYFLAHGDRVRRAAGRDQRLVRARAVYRWMLGRDTARFGRSDAWQSLRRNSAFAQPEDLDEPLRLLSVHRCVRWVKGADGGPGRPSALGQYEVNPALLREAGGTEPDARVGI